MKIYDRSFGSAARGVKNNSRDYVVCTDSSITPCIIILYYYCATGTGKFRLSHRTHYSEVTIPAASADGVPSSERRAHVVVVVADTAYSHLAVTAGVISGWWRWRWRRRRRRIGLTKVDFHVFVTRPDSLADTRDDYHCTYAVIFFILYYNVCREFRLSPLCIMLRARAGPCRV